MTSVIAGLKAVVDHKTKVLILGSFPSAISLKKCEYYVNPNNQFWHLLSGLLKFDFLKVGYQDRLRHLRSNRIGLWDVIKSCKREGSRDSKITDATLNDLQGLLREFPNIKVIFLNGRKAERLLKAQGLRFPEVRYLPSSSSAFALAYKNKKEKWSKILNFL